MPEPLLIDAYSTCERLAQTHYENFPVASFLLPRGMRRHVAAVYAFARIADDFADEPGRADDERYARLDEWVARLHACGGSGGGAAPAASEHDRVFLALGHTIRECRLPVDLFEDLISAFRQDVGTVRYERWSDLLDYCRRSANPVGRLVLRIAGYERPALDRSADALCTALQLTNFWQDFAIDWGRGRLYLPAETWRAAGARETDLAAGRLTPAWRAALQAAVAQTDALFARGRAVCDGVAGRLRFELRLTWLGGRRILDRLERGGFDPFTARPSLGAADLPSLLCGALAWPRTRIDES